MATDEWYRSADWDPMAQAEFERRLGHARPHNRVQYRRIKAITLLKSGDPSNQRAGRDLLEGNALNAEANGFERTMALSVLGMHELDTGRMDEAERHLRAALDRLETDPNGGSNLEGVCLAEVLLARGDLADLREAEDLLRASASDPPLLVRDRFRMCVAGVRVALALKDEGAAYEWAKWAIQLAGATHSGLRNHPSLGSSEADPGTVSWLREIVASRVAAVQRNQ